MLDAIIADISHYRGKSIFNRLPETAPWTLEGCRKDLEGQRHGTSRGAAPVAPPLEVQGAAPLEVPGDKF